MKLPREFYCRDGITVARELLGKILVCETKEGVTKGRIVETEAYMGTVDKAAHSYKNPASKRTRIQLSAGGFAYVYRIYGIHTCMNIVANLPGIPEAVLIRALEPVEGIDLMRRRRGTEDIRKLCSGPGKLCQAMDITMKDYGADLLCDRLFLEDGPVRPEEQILATKRIHIDYAEEAREFLWRFVIKDSPYVSLPPPKA